MANIPNLAGVATKDLVDTIGTGRFQASYINWARTINLLHENAPGWMVNYVANSDGGLVHRAPVGGYLLIGFVMYHKLYAGHSSMLQTAIEE